VIATPSLVFTTGVDPFQLLINVGTCSVAGHAALGLGDQLLHAYEDGVKLEPRSTWLGRDRQRLIAEFLILPDVGDGIDFALSQVGKGYDASGVVRAAISRLLRLTLSPIQYLGPASMKKHTCAAFVMLIDPYGRRIPEWSGFDRATIVPGDLLAAAAIGPSFQRVA
jgi:hypothetical protein